ncbi:unnamed protein product [Mytilus coruscus]|uniref:CARD domain-containing protein n=1 Tax=Mytilus coruscus TaxID=42192 RepID=A0A6J8DP34_MYTCO|nr:unnamed protein product [Mytilus coruscus]
MSDETSRLTRCLSFIKENTTQIEKILDKLIEDGIIGMDERAQILANQLLENQLHSVIEKIIRKQAYQSFLSALKTTGNNHVVDKIIGLHFPKDKKDNQGMNREKTYTVNSIEEEGEEKSHYEQYVKEKTLEELKLENDRLKTQQSIVREQLNEKYKKIQELKIEVQNYKRQNTELNEKLKSYEELQVRMEGIEEELQDKDKMNKIIEIALCERSEEIDRLQQQCEELKVESEEKSEQISYLTGQMELLKIELGKASEDRHRLKQTIIEMSNSMEEKFVDMMSALNDLKAYKQAQCEVTTPRNSSSSRYQYGRRGQPLALTKTKYRTQHK